MQQVSPPPLHHHHLHHLHQQQQQPFHDAYMSAPSSAALSSTGFQFSPEPTISSLSSPASSTREAPAPADPAHSMAAMMTGAFSFDFKPSPPLMFEHRRTASSQAHDAHQHAHQHSMSSGGFPWSSHPSSGVASSAVTPGLSFGGTTAAATPARQSPKLSLRTSGGGGVLAAAEQDTPQRSSSSLHLGDLESWMDEVYIRECCAAMAWDGVQGIKLIRGTANSAGYCFLTFPSSSHAAAVLSRYLAAPPVLMPRSSRTFKLNWATGLPGVQPTWDGEWSVFVGDLGKEVGEADLVSLFAPLFPSTKSAKIMYDPATGISKGYGFIRFSDERDMHRALKLGHSTQAGCGLSLHGRTLRISEASGSSGDSSKERARSKTDSSLVGAGAAGGAGAVGAARSASPSEIASSPFAATRPLPPPLATSSAPATIGYSRPATQQHPPASHTADPNNTTVFVGGLPACVSEETLRSYFNHFGEIAYCKIPPGKGCGFVQYLRRADAEVAIAKMHDFPIHGKSRIRVSWGRSQGDKQVEHVRKLAGALNVPFDTVWRMVQNQDTKQQQKPSVANVDWRPSVSPPSSSPPRTSAGYSNGGGPGLGAIIAHAAGLTESEVHELARSSQASAPSQTVPIEHGAAAGPYSRVSPSVFSAAPFAPSNQGPFTPPALSPPPGSPTQPRVDAFGSPPSYTKSPPPFGAGTALFGPPGSSFDYSSMPPRQDDAAHQAARLRFEQAGQLQPGRHQQQATNFSNYFAGF